MNPRKKFLFIEPWGLGDTLQMMPMIQGCRNSFPDSRIVLVMAHESLYTIFPKGLVDSVIFCSSKGRWAVLRTLWALRLEGFDFGVLNSRASIFLRLFVKVGMRVSVVFGGLRRPWQAPTKSRIHQVTELVESFKRYFPKIEPAESTYMVSDEDLAWADGLFGGATLPKNRRVALHLGSDSRQTYKRLPKSIVESVINFLMTKNSKILLIEGPNELGTGDWLVKKYENNVIRVSDIPLRKVAAALRQVQFTIAGDSGIGHLSSALGTPVVTIAGPTEIDRTRPWGLKNEIFRLEPGLNCQPCHGTAFAYKCKSKECLEKIDINTLLSNLWRTWFPIELYPQQLSR